jgi:predicted ATP-dependent endonuclease of OLD family
MKIEKIVIKNYRLLKDFKIDLENNISLVIGKNNTAKTSFLLLLNKFLNDNKRFSFDDFNIEIQEEIGKVIDKTNDDSDYFYLTLKLYISYNHCDSLENMSNLILNLSPDENILVLSFEYYIDKENIEKAQNDFEEFKTKFSDKTSIDFLKRFYSKYFTVAKKVVEFGEESNSIEIEDKQIKKIINFKFISAKRDGTTDEGEKTLSALSYRFFNSSKTGKTTDITGLQKKLIETDSDLDDAYKETFKDIIKNVQKFSYNESESELIIKSNLEALNILKKNTSVAYKHSGYLLPEDYNGLGYMNLFAMIFNIHIILDSFKKKNNDSEKQADLNLFFIEEPEAHTHPQMQYVFIKNIKSLLQEEGAELKNLQTIISTHSAHITSQSDFNDIKYFYKATNNIIVKNLSELETVYGNEEEGKRNFQFLKQYLTLNRAELFFSDKIILIEGDTERILFPAMMKKIDLENNSDGYLPLLSQKISISEVGAYAHIFEKFIEFLNIKTLIITDIDSVNETQNACKVLDGADTSNASIKFFLKNKNFDTIKDLDFSKKVLNKNNGNWKVDKNGKLCLVFQTEENSYHARSFEDAFISINYDFIKTNKEHFNSLKNKSDLNDNPDYYDIASNCIKKKSMFASEILYYSDDNYSEWQIPNYIKEGLLWLAK